MSNHKCPKCGHVMIRNGLSRGKQQWLCKKCRYQYRGEEEEPRPDEKEKYRYDEQGRDATLSGVINTNSTDRPKILHEFLKQCQVDTEVWMVDRYMLNAWDVTMSAYRSHTNLDSTYTNYQIKVWLKRKEVPVMELGYERFIERIPEFRFTTPPAFKAASGTALEISLFDAHIGKLAWEDEIGRESYDLRRAVSDYEYSVAQILNWSSPHKPQRIFYIVGQDLLHVDNMQGVTPHGGNNLDVDGRLPKIFETAFEAVTKGIYLARAIAPVEVIWVPGNHDEHASLFLCYALKQHFRNDKYVDVDVTPQPRKVRLWGNLLVGWTHEINNRQESWANELAQAFPQEWAQSKFREWHHGHKHKKKEVKVMPVLTSGGVLCRQLTALSEIDKWHYDNLFTDAVPGGEGFLWSKDFGVFSNLTAWTKERKRT